MTERFMVRFSKLGTPSQPVTAKSPVDLLKQAASICPRGQYVALILHMRDDRPMVWNHERWSNSTDNGWYPEVLEYAFPQLAVDSNKNFTATLTSGRTVPIRTNSPSFLLQRAKEHGSVTHLYLGETLVWSKASDWKHEQLLTAFPFIYHKEDPWR